MSVLEVFDRAYAVGDVVFVETFRIVNNQRVGQTRRVETHPERCAACDAPLFGTVRTHHHAENGEDVTQ